MSSGAAYMWAGKITGEPFAPPAMAQDMPKGGILKIAQRIPKVDNPHTFSWVYDSNVVRQVCGYLTRTGVDNVTRPHLCDEMGSVRRPQDLDLHIMADAKWRKGERRSPPSMPPGTSSIASIRKSAPRSSA